MSYTSSATVQKSWKQKAAISPKRNNLKKWTSQHE